MVSWCNVILNAEQLAEKHIAILLYKGNFALPDHIGLKIALQTLTEYCIAKALEINYNKIKVLVFAKHSKMHTRKLNNYPFEQVKSFKYFGIVFHATTTYSLEYVIQKAKKT